MQLHKKINHVHFKKWMVYLFKDVLMRQIQNQIILMFKLF